MTTNIDLPPIPDKQFFPIGEVSRILQLPAYVLRYWESQFRILRPMRRNSGQRKYTRNDIETVFQVKDLLHNKKFTIAGAKKYLSGDRRKKDETVTLNVNMGEKSKSVDTGVLKEVKQELEEILKILKK
jgi:DNA-binding transcriptional MerR regulator